MQKEKGVKVERQKKEAEGQGDKNREKHIKSGSASRKDKV